jgi:hypothetical protein
MAIFMCVGYFYFHLCFSVLFFFVNFVVNEDKQNRKTQMETQKCKKGKNPMRKPFVMTGYFSDAHLNLKTVRKVGWNEEEKEMHVAQL